MIVAFAPIVGLLLGLSAITVPWATLFLSVVLYIVIPVALAQLWRRSLLRRGGEAALQATLQRRHPVSLGALLATLVLLFGFQGGPILQQPLIIAMLALPILIQGYFNSGLAYLLNRQLGVAHSVAGPSALIGEEKEGLRFHPAGLTETAIARVPQQTRRRVRKRFARREWWPEEATALMLGWDHSGGFSLNAEV